MGQEGDPEVPEPTPETVQESLRGPEGSLSKESLLRPGTGSPSEKPPEPSIERCHKLPVFLRRVTRTHLLAAVIAVLIVTVAVLAVLEANQRSGAAEDLKDGEVLPPCEQDWIWYWNKCYYFSEAGGTWTKAEASCAALNSTLATIDTQKELDFLLRFKGDDDRWIGLRRDSERRWRWINGTELSNWFTVAGHSDYAYLDHLNVKSGESYNTQNWICNKVSTYERKYKREKTLPSFHRGI